jgi:beta-lactamase superfamily II metal-dependent hydrolase
VDTSAERSFVAEVGSVPNVLTSTMIHIGWGDAHLITMPTSGKRILIDGGEPGAAEALRYYFEQHGIDDLDAALATHVHADHIGGLVGVDVDEDGEYEIPGAIARFGPESFLDSPSKTHFRSLYGELNSLLSEMGIDRPIVRRGDRNQSFAEFSRWDPQVEVLCLNSGRADDVPIKTYDGDNINNESIVLRFSYGEVDFIIGGDCELECELSIVNAFGGSELEAEYFKAHHHGRYDGTGSTLLQAVNPRVALLPVSWKEYRGGWEDYLGDSAAALGRLDRARVDWFAIDDQPLLDRRQSSRNYNITFATDGLSYELRFEWALQPTKMPVARTWIDDCAHLGSRYHPRESALNVPEE